jgi:hypothetical protein
VAVGQVTEVVAVEYGCASPDITQVA